VLTRRHIETLNASPKEAKNRTPLVAGGTALAALLLFLAGFVLLGSPPIGAALAVVALVGGGAFILSHGRRDARSQAIELRYGMMDAATAARFSRIEKAFEILMKSERIWLPERREDGGVEDKPVQIQVSDPPGVSTDVDVWTIDTGSSQTYFLPEAVLLHEEDRYRAISYRSFRVDLSTERITEEGEVPGDAEVVGRTWRYLAEDGVGPDRTRSFNPQLPQVLYGVLGLRAGSWRGPDFWVSSESAAAQFVLAFLDGKNSNLERVERWQGVRPYEERGRGDPAYAVLGLEDGAPKTEVTAAYRRIARAYHPDKTARFVPEFRAIADRRMQEINAAYSRLRREAT
jgi:hypothetical protein